MKDTCPRCKRKVHIKEYKIGKSHNKVTIVLCDKCYCHFSEIVKSLEKLLPKTSNEDNFYMDFIKRYLANPVTWGK